MFQEGMFQKGDTGILMNVGKTVLVLIGVMTAAIIVANMVI